MAIEIVSFPIKNGGSFHSYVKLPEGNSPLHQNRPRGASSRSAASRRLAAQDGRVEALSFREVRCHVETCWTDGIMANLWENMGNLWENMGNLYGKSIGNLWKTMTGWWFGTFGLMFPHWEFHHPKWRTHIFQKGRYTSNQLCLFHVYYAYLCIFGFGWDGFGASAVEPEATEPSEDAVLWDVVPHHSAPPSLTCSKCEGSALVEHLAGSWGSDRLRAGVATHLIHRRVSEV